MSTQTMNEKDALIQTCGREYPTTLKILRAYPAGRDDFKPAEKSNTARQLAWTFVLELKVAGQALDGAIDFSAGMAPAPAKSVAQLADMLEQSQRELLAKLRNTTESDLNRMVDTPTGPKQMGKVRAIDFLWMMLMDSIHHRGQLSVYLRLVGAKVPSIYGPTADEPWM